MWLRTVARECGVRSSYSCGAAEDFLRDLTRKVESGKFPLSAFHTSSSSGHLFPCIRLRSMDYFCFPPYLFDWVNPAFHVFKTANVCLFLLWNNQNRRLICFGRELDWESTMNNLSLSVGESVYGSRRSPGLRYGEDFLACLSRLPILNTGQDSGWW
jgi:hypothetical protein